MMRKINTLFKQSSLLTHKVDSQFARLANEANAHLNLRQFWQAVAPNMLSQHSFAGNLNNGLLTIYANNAAVAAKIKLTSANLLSQLQNLALSDPFYKECKVTAITVKVQVKSTPKPIVKTPRKLSKHAANGLKTLAEQLGDGALADKLKQLANKSQ